MPDRNALRLSSVLLIVALFLTIGFGLLHPGKEDPNNHLGVFAEYSGSASWIAVHLGQFIAFMVFAAALIVLFFALNLSNGLAGWANRLAAVSTVITLALYGVLQAVDGVVLKRAVDSWVSAPVAEKAARFAAADVIRWLEEGVRSYYDFMLGVTLLLFAVAIVSGARVPRPIGYMMGLCGISYLVQGWVVGTEGFSANHGLAQLPAYLFLLAWVIWLAISSLRVKTSGAGQVDPAAG
jgi:hypothetical protein